MTTGTVERAAEPTLLSDLVTEVVRDVLGAGPIRSAVVAMSRDENPKATVLVRPERAHAPSIAVKVGLTKGAARAVLREADVLRRLEQLDPTRVHGTVPGCLDVRTTGEHAVLVSSACPGVPLSTTYHRWRHTATSARVRADFAAAAAWLADLGRLDGESGVPDAARGRTDWPERVRRRWPDDEVAERVAAAVSERRDRIGHDGTSWPTGVVHGDFWCGNVLREGEAVTGVVDWEHACLLGDPVRDRARFALAYALYLDRHTPAGHRVAGHPGLVAGRWGEPVRHLVSSPWWFAEIVAGFVGDGLATTGRDPARWRDVLVVGLAEIAALSDHADFARQHLELAAEVIA